MIIDFVKNHMRFILPAAVAVLAVVVLGMVIFLVQRSRSDATTGGLRVYYFNPSEGRLQGVDVTIPAGPPMMQLNALLTRLTNPPSSLKGVLPGGMSLPELDFHEGLAGVALPYIYNEMPVFDMALFRTALTLTFTQLPFVERVMFLVAEEGEEPLTQLAEWLRAEENRDFPGGRIESPLTVANDPSITPGAVRPRTITLYFVCADGVGLVTETFTDEYMDEHRMAEFKLNHLIAGPEGDNAMRIIPPDTTIRTISFDRDPNRLYVDFSGEFSSRFIGSPALAGLMLQSIVNTLTLPSNQRRNWEDRVLQVSFAVNTERPEVFHGVTGFNLPFTYDHGITLESDIPDDPDPDTNGEEPGENDGAHTRPPGDE
jgi:spore germination protein GerM